MIEVIRGFEDLFRVETSSFVVGYVWYSIIFVFIIRRCIVFRIEFFVCIVVGVRDIVVVLWYRF